MWTDKLFAAIGIGTMALAANIGVDQEQQQAKEGPETVEARRDVGKSMIEAPVEELLVEVPEVDASKFRVERPTEALVDISKNRIETVPEGFMAAAATNALFATDGKHIEVNPACEPGLVNWHDSFEAACAASRESGKPVMLFQLLGKLDQRFT